MAISGIAFYCIKSDPAQPTGASVRRETSLPTAPSDQVDISSPPRRQPKSSELSEIVENIQKAGRVGWWEAA